MKFLKPFVFAAFVSSFLLISQANAAADVRPPEMVAKQMMKTYLDIEDKWFSEQKVDKKLTATFDSFKTKEYLKAEKQFNAEIDEAQKDGDMAFEYDIYWNGQDHNEIDQYTFVTVEKNSEYASVLMSTKWGDDYSFNCFQFRLENNEWKLNDIINQLPETSPANAAKLCKITNKPILDQQFSLITK